MQITIQKLWANCQHHVHISLKPQWWLKSSANNRIMNTNNNNNNNNHSDIFPAFPVPLKKHNLRVIDSFNWNGFDSWSESEDTMSISKIVLFKVPRAMGSRTIFRSKYHYWNIWCCFLHRFCCICSKVGQMPSTQIRLKMDSHYISQKIT